MAGPEEKGEVLGRCGTGARQERALEPGYLSLLSLVSLASPRTLTADRGRGFCPRLAPPPPSPTQSPHAHRVPKERNPSPAPIGPDGPRAREAPPTAPVRPLAGLGEACLADTAGGAWGEWRLGGRKRMPMLGRGVPGWLQEKSRRELREEAR